MVGKIASERFRSSIGIVDLSLAPTPCCGDSVCHVLEEMGPQKLSGTWHDGSFGDCWAGAVKKAGVMACNHWQLSGAVIQYLRMQND